MKKILKISPHFEYRVWAGENIKNIFNIDQDSIGEAWVISAFQDKSSKIENLNNVDLYTFYNDKRNAYFFGNYNLYYEYPLLSKIIDAKDDLSVQIHPDNEYAKQFGSLGKAECWYVLDTKPNNSIVLGHNVKTLDDFKSMVKLGRWDELLKHKPIKKGDFIYVESTKIHAIKGGSLIFELQQSSDITYRVYDYDRLDKGQKRELHLDHVFNLVKTPDIDLNKSEITNKSDYLVSNKMFNLLLIENAGNKTYEFNDALWLQVTVIDGEGKINNLKSYAFDSFLIAHNEKLNVSGKMKILVSFINN